MEVKYHVRLSAAMLAGAEYVLLPGDPGRVKKTAKHLDPGAVFLAQNREYTSWLATLAGRKVLVCSSGIGGPSLGIAVEELAALGVKNFIRIGTTGAIQPDIPVPCLIITTGAVRLDGTSGHYVPPEFPAVADFELTAALVNGARAVKAPYRIGITASSDTFYPGQERYDTHTGYVIRRFQGSLKEWQKLHVLNYEMEAAPLFAIASAFGLRAATICAAIVNRTKSEKPNDRILRQAETLLASAVKKALEMHFSGGEEEGNPRPRKSAKQRPN